jgi:hypothetical protein
VSAGGFASVLAPITPPAAPAAPCSHTITKPADWPRWRICDECGHTVHRVETDDYRQLVADGRLWVPQPLDKKDKP